MHVLITAERLFRGEPFALGVPEEAEATLKPGCMVLISTTGGRQSLSTAYILETDVEAPPSHPPAELTDILYGGERVLSQPMMRLTEWMAGYYLTRRIDCITATIPLAVRTTVDEIVEPSDFTLEAEERSTKNTALRRRIMQLLHQEGRLTVKQLQRRLGKKQLYRTLSELERGGHLKITRKISSTSQKTAPAWRIAPTLPAEPEEGLKNTPKQLETFHRIAAFGPGGASLDASHASRRILNTLTASGYLEKIDIPLHGRFDTGMPTPDEGTKKPTAAQRTALAALSDAVRKAAYHTFLLHGVTGSGKTLVYIEFLKEVLARGKTAIVLVPEIALTPQTAGRFRQHFGDAVTIMHSAMGRQEKYDAWHSLRSGRTRIALGARSTIFAPLENLGAIIVDEEHDGAYKQDRNPRYNARDIAVMRARTEGAICILGSATPSFESYGNALQGKYTRLTLPERIDGATMPTLCLVVMKDSPKATPSISDKLRHEMAKRLEKNEQIILLQNRRGFSGSVLCFACGHVPQCPHCGIPMVYHAGHRQLRCHYCGHTEPFSNLCPSCSSPDLFFKGSGTERIEEELQTLFPEERILRMDVDTTTTKGSHGRILDEFREGKARILLGTQMVAKGLDFPNVTLVGVLMADIGLNLPDFRASERMYSLLTQVSGRAGRSSTPGEVYLQVYNRENEVFNALLTGSYSEFFKLEMASRKELGYPPYTKLVKFECSSPDEPTAQKAAEVCREMLQTALTDTKGQVLGPAPASIAKIRGNYRYHLLVKLTEARLTEPFARYLQHEITSRFRNPAATVSIDVDPGSLM
ncbi:replication restart helicase PriA [Chlorobium phaeovibrioides]|uniref:Replication restart protein PriA n=1 Tax=Chlorobium phaeovibrioides TaxID=1094 RepID=A0ABW9UP69_CHLPH|nr:primosomal protein N' [Chlorobium phaeovibrioides]MWV53722.1 primosomal protein N' [Chlorobium phaeovibrioides]